MRHTEFQPHSGRHHLTNQLMIDGLADKDEIEKVKSYQRIIREWLLQRLQRITKNDFMEYNAKPYHRLSTAAILNIYDFARHLDDPKRKDVELKTAARIVLSYASAKAALGSNQSRRIVPFRRLIETNRYEIFGPSPEGLKPRRITDFNSGADHQVAAMLLFSGQTQQLPRNDFGKPLLASESTGEMIWEATSSYQPHEIILDLAINRSVPYEQRFHHAGYEIYSSGPGFLVTAGGVMTPHALGMLLTPFDFNITPPAGFRLKNADRGVGVPTTLMVASGARQLGRNDFIRFEGAYGEISHEERNYDISDLECETVKVKAEKDGCKRNLTNDHNLCVRKGFACGMNLRMPLGIDELCVRPAPNVVPEWEFMDSKVCSIYKDAAPFFLVVFRRPCPPSDEYCKDNWGFFEAVPRPVGVSFSDFVRQTVERNPLALLESASSMHGVYNSWRGERITYSIRAHLVDSDRSGIVSVNNVVEKDIGDWALAEGDAIKADDQGKITIRSPGRESAPGSVMSIKIDFTDWENPKFEELQ
jgi:hypothetical protein